MDKLGIACDVCEADLNDPHDWSRHHTCQRQDCNRKCMSKASADCPYCLQEDLRRIRSHLFEMTRADAHRVRRGRTLSFEENEANELTDERLDKQDGRLY